jgi:hypothetical protein
MKKKKEKKRKEIPSYATDNDIAAIKEAYLHNTKKL